MSDEALRQANEEYEWEQNRGKLKIYDALYREVMDCSQCDLGCEKLLEGYDPHVMGQGNLNADFMFMAESPGKEETKHQQPLTTTGVSGSLYEKVLKKLGLERDEVYTTNTVLCRPPRNRDPEFWEVKKCEKYFIRQLEMVDPKIVITFGRFAAQAMLGQFKITQEHGQLRISDKFSVPVFPMYHPSYIRSYASAAKRAEFDEDIEKLQEIIQDL